MARHVFVVMTNPVAGKEAEYNEWYTNVHLPEVLEVPGFVAAQRFALADAQLRGPGEFRYLALYEIEADDAATALEALRAARPRMRMSDALDRRIEAFAYTPITERLEAKTG